MSIKTTTLSLLFLFCLAISEAQPVIIFEETFDGGIPNNWEVSPGQPEGAIWQWTASGKADSVIVSDEAISALFWGSRPPIASPSADNGAAMYNSDAYDSAGTGVGDGPFPQEQEGSLTSPNINCAFHPVVYLKFNQYARAFLNAPSTRVSVSANGGETWEYFTINREVTENRSTHNDNVALLDISSVAGGQQEVRIRFTWRGRYHFWLIDDVQLITPPEVELKMSSVPYLPASYTQPQAQIQADTFRFSARISNLGYEPADSLLFKISLLQRIGALEELIFSDSLILDTLPALQQDSLLVIPNPYLPNLPEGDYRTLYEIGLKNGEDYNPTDNTKSTYFRISPDRYAKEDDIDVGYRPESSGDYEVGNIYQFDNLQSDPFVVESVTFSAAKDSIDGPLSGERVNLTLYRVAEEVAEDYSNFDLNSYAQLTPIGIQQFTFPQGSQNFQLFTTGLSPVSGDIIQLTPGQRYLLTAYYTGSANKIYHAFNDDISYEGVSTIVYREGWFLGGFGPDEASVLRLQLQPMSASSTQEPQAAANSLVLYPNPANDYIFVRLPATRSVSSIVLTNEQGQLIEMSDIDANANPWDYQLDISRLPAGNYWVQLLSSRFRAQGYFIKI